MPNKRVADHLDEIERLLFSVNQDLDHEAYVLLDRDVPALIEALKNVMKVQARYASQYEREAPLDNGLLPPRSPISAEKVARDIRNAVASVFDVRRP